jgi:hypothetical protein
MTAYVGWRSLIQTTTLVGSVEFTQPTKHRNLNNGRFRDAAPTLHGFRIITPLPFPEAYPVAWAEVRSPIKMIN